MNIVITVAEGADGSHEVVLTDFNSNGTTTTRTTADENGVYPIVWQLLTYLYPYKE